MPVRSRSLVVASAIVLVAMIGIVAALRSPARRAAAVAGPDSSGAALDLVSNLGVASGWINGDPHALDSLTDHPVVVALWSDTDPRCIDGLPLVQEWHQAYRHFGVVVIGVYAPEFSFGVDSTVPLRIARRLGLTFPIALDPSYLVRSRLGRSAGENGVIVVGADGRVRLASNFENLAGVDRAIRAELSRTHPDLQFPAEPEAARLAPRRDLRFVYLGAGRVESGPLADAASGRTETFTTQFRFQEEGKNYVPMPVGRWTPTAEGLTAARGGASDFLAIRNPGDRVDAVMSPRLSGSSRVWILADQGWLPASARGADVRVDARGASYVDVTEPRIYEIAKAGAERVLRFSPEQPGVTLHAFTFERGAAKP